MEDGVRKAGQDGVSIFCSSLVKSDLSISAANCESSSVRGSHHAEIRRLLVLSLTCDFTPRRKARVQSEEGVVRYCSEDTLIRAGRVFAFVGKLQQALADFPLEFELVHHFAMLHIEIDNSVRIALVGKE